MSAAMKRTSKSHENLAEEASYNPPIYEPTAGKKALNALAAELDGVTDAERATMKVDVEGATYAALGVVGFVSSLAVRARFARLPKDEFDIDDLDSLGLACFATLYAMAEARMSEAFLDNVRLPTDLVSEAAEIEARMQSVCEYHLTGDPEIQPELDRLRPGTGYRDLANDLLGYARLYELHADVVKKDGRHFRESDVERARELSGVIIQRLSVAMTPKARAAYDRYGRAWTLLCNRYDEVRAAGLWLFRKDPRGSQRFPSLFTVARQSGRRPRRALKDIDVPLADKPVPASGVASP